MRTETIENVPPGRVDEVSRSFRERDNAVRVCQERQNDGNWRIVAELPA
jgi:hypothetical protein